MTTLTTGQSDRSAAFDAAGSASAASDLPRWTAKRWIAAVVLALMSMAALYDVWYDLGYRALTDEEASHILLVPAIVGWLAFLRRKRAAAGVVRRQWVGLLIVAVAWIAYTVGDKFTVVSLWQASAVIGLAGALVVVLGTDLIKYFGPALLVLIFMVPMPNRARQAVTLPMQQIAAAATEGVLTTVGTGVERQGNMLTINGTQVTVAEACNGLRMTHALILVAVAFAFASPFRWWVRLLVLALSPAFAIGCNIVRLVPTVWFYGLFDADAADLLHDLGGWVMLFIGYVVLTGFVWVLEFLRFPVQRPTAIDAITRPSMTGAFVGWPIAATVILLAGIVAERAYHGVAPVDATRYHEQVAEAADEVPTSAGPWIGRDTPVPTQAEGLLQPVAIVSRTYQNISTGRQVGFLAVQTHDIDKLMGHYPPNCYPSQAWTPVGTKEREWTVDDLTIRGVEYQFRPPNFDEKQPPITIINFITAPGGHLLRTMDELEVVAQDRSRGKLGAGQFQLLFYAGEDEALRDEIFARFVRMSRPLITAMTGEPEELDAASDPSPETPVATAAAGE